MSRQKLRIANTETDNLIANLRGEVGEVITTWILMRHFMAEASQQNSQDPTKDLDNKAFSVTNILIDKLRDELVARLSELGEEKVGRLSFHFAMVKLRQFQNHTKAFTQFIVRNKLRAKRNYDISHKELPERWSEHRHIYIPYRTILQSVAAAIRLMKRIDRFVLGPSAPYLWREARKRRYSLMHPPRAAYMLVPHLRLSGKDRLLILAQESKEGTVVWSEMPTTFNGTPTMVMACRKWGIIVVDDRTVAVEQYPLNQLMSISTDVPNDPNLTFPVS